MEIPWKCRNCNQENMVDFEKLSTWPVDKLITAQGFRCEYCETMEAVAYMTISLENQLRNLLRYPPEHPKFGFLFRKAVRKAEGVYLRGEIVYGALRRKYLAPA
jgi:hypothetical protein